MPIFFLLGGKALLGVSAKAAGTKIVLEAIGAASVFFTTFGLEKIFN